MGMDVLLLKYLQVGVSRRSLAARNLRVWNN